MAYFSFLNKISQFGTNINDTFNKNSAMQKLPEEELSLYASAIIKGSLNGVLIADENYRFIFANEMAAQITGYSTDELTHMDFRMLLSEESREKVALYYKLRQQGKKVPQNYEATFIHKNGTCRNISISSLAVNIEGLPPRTIAQVLDITEQKQAQAHNEHLVRLYNVLRRVNQSFQKAETAGELYNDICHIFTEYGHFALCWIGVPDEKREVKIEALSGPESSYMNKLSIRLENPKEREGPTAQAFLSGRYQINNKLQDNPTYQPWVNNARSHGLQASAAFPIIVNNRVEATINLYSYETDFFDEDEIDLLTEAAADIGFALEKMAGEIREKEILKQLKLSEQRYHTISEMISDYTYAHQITDTGQLSPVWTMGDIQSICGYSEKRVVNDNLWSKLVHRDDLDIFKKHASLLSKGQKSTVEYRIIAKDGRIHWIQDYAFILQKDDNQRQVVGAIKDITLLKQLHQERAEYSEKMTRIYETLADAIVVMDNQLIITDVNEAAITMFGYKRKRSLIGKPAMRFLNADALSDVVLRLKGLEVSEKLSNIPMKGARVKGKSFPIEVSFSKLLDEKEKWIGLVAVVKDVTLRDRKNREIKSIKEQLENIIANSPAALYALEVRRSKQIPIFVSDNLPVMLGYTLQEFSHDEKWWKSRIHPDDLKRVLDNQKKLYREGHLIHEYRIRHKKGHYIWIHDELNVVRNEHDIPIMIMGSWVNITERKMAEEELRFLALALRSVNEYVSITDLSDKLIFVNEALCQAYGYSSEELLGQDVRVLQSKNESENPVKKISAATQAGGWQGELINLRKDGSTFPIHLSTSVVRDDKKEPIAYIGVARDISELKDLQERLLQAHRMEAIGRLAGGVAHDFNNLLTVILGSCQLAQLQFEPDHAIMPLMTQIEHASDRAAQLTRQLLAFSRKQVMETKLFNINDSIRHMAKMLYRLLGEHIELNLILDDDLGAILADPSQFEMVVMNLCVNSRDAMPNGGKIEIKTSTVQFSDVPHDSPDLEPDVPYACMSIKDTGYGMSSDILPHIFEPFFTTKAEGHGTGLGLSTVYGIVKQSHGTISVDSSDSGTTFSLYFPISSPEKVEAPAHQVLDLPEGRGHILVVEDQLEVRTLVQNVLKIKGYHVRAIGPESFQQTLDTSGEFDLLITDVVMPRITGVEVARAFSEKYPRARVLFMSGYTSDIIKESGWTISDENILRKPFSPRELLSRVADLIPTGKED